MLYYKVYGKSPEKEWLILIHPLGGSSKAFYRQIKEFQKYFNLLTLDLPGHGRSQDMDILALNIDTVTKEIYEVLKKENIESTYLLGVCLGNVIVDLLIKENRIKIKGVVYGAAVTKLNYFHTFLLNVGKVIKKFSSHSFLYTLFAYIIIPTQKKSRLIFIAEAKKMKRENFFRWFQLIVDHKNFYNTFNSNSEIPSLYIYGDEDYLFIKKTKEYIKGKKNKELLVINNSGHMCNIDNFRYFNKVALEFLTFLN
ncbi:2-succinyl-6-hydroxy-2,4-cyclohexadiene-1-carboxylate synthase [Fusobacterium necrogenes]|uniref:2-succinyl-6-hydroxy-2,4-cyclohexadiene-1-carboxy late synthase n=1 Tax=Fusobacterium necrogenes TaxID=858 RepID=A0A377GW06_9FUSO|nr:alpha/beta hydrolase [Fusobacterium necrogenes]STO31158.1 2-succinyl-6-hydroxy-2,4-cyclohexadiene-1-carboxylate synthase [Fusobacterium necrogenes]